MILHISTFWLFSIFAFMVISQMDFSQFSIQLSIDMDHSNRYQHTHSIKSHTKLLNDCLQQLSTCTQNTLKLDQKINVYYKYVRIQALVSLIYYAVLLINISTMECFLVYYFM
eukprot:129216_1